MASWLTDLFCWGLNILLIKENRTKLVSYLEIVISLIMTTIVALPWQLYILRKFPRESKFEFDFNSLHFFEALEGHKGDTFYHLNKVETLFGTDFQYVIIASLIILLFSRVKGKYKFALLTWVIIVYAFYSFAATIMPAFTIIIASIIYIIVAQALSNLYMWLDKIKCKFRVNSIFLKVFSIALVFYLFFHFLNHDKLSLKNSDWDQKVFQRALTST